MASLLRHTASRRYAAVVNGHANATTRAWSSSTRLRSMNVEEWDARQEQAAIDGQHARVRKYSPDDTGPRVRKHAVHASKTSERVDPKRSPPRLNKEASNATSTEQTIDSKRVHKQNAKVLVSGLPGDHAFSAVFLRDLCSCPRCVDQSTRQKLFVTADIPNTIKAADVQSDAGSVKITWSNDVPGYDADHVSEFSLATLSRYATNGNNLPSHDKTPRVLWDAGMYRQQTRDFDYEAYMEDDTILLKALRQLQSHGLLFVTNVPGDEKSVKRLSKRIGPLKTTFYGKTWDVRSVPKAKNVAYTSQNLGFHMDLMYMKQPPHLQLLHCIRSSSAGGASLFTDSFKAAVDLCDSDIRAFNDLSYFPIDYHYDHKTDYYHQSRPVIEQKPVNCKGVTLDGYARQTHVRGHDNPLGINIPAIDFIDCVSWSPPFQAPFQIDGAKANLVGKLLNRKVDNWHDAASKFNQLIHRPEAIYERLMKPGECVIFDNRRVLHARKAFEVGDQGKERWLRGAYIDKDPFMSKLKILNDQYGGANEAEQKSTEVHDAYFEMQQEA